MNKYSVVAVAVLALLCLSPRPVLAAICTVSGKVEIQSVDSFYCDNDLVSHCASWNESDLDVGYQPMKHLLLTVHEDTPLRPLIGKTVTETDGTFSFQFTRATCPSTISLTEWLVARA